MDGQKEARKREPADMQIKKGEKWWTFEIINYALYLFILFKKETNLDFEKKSF